MVHRMKLWHRRREHRWLWQCCPLVAEPQCDVFPWAGGSRWWIVATWQAARHLVKR